MSGETRAGFSGAFDGNLDHGGLAEFEPEATRQPQWHDVELPIRAPLDRWEQQAAGSDNRLWPFVVPVVAAAAIVAATFTWLRLGPDNPLGFSAVAQTPGASAAPTPSDPASMRLVVPAPVEVPAAGAAPPAAGPVTAAPATDAPTVPGPPPEASALDPAFDRTLAAVSDAYRTRDAAALTAVWPGVDTAALQQAFAGLRYQAISFERCSVHREGSGALASCDVVLSTVSSADPSLQRRREWWTLALDRSSSDRWTITGISVR
jgi:hypothetical protein